MDEQSNLELWNRYASTPPEFTKRVEPRKGYHFTAVDAHYQLELATSEWGPYGSTWGLRKCNYQIIQPHGGIDDDGEKYFERPTLVLMAEFYYPGGDFEVAADIPWRRAYDCHKRVLTTARSKALSSLGFNSDVFLGRFDDPAYIAEVRAKYADQNALRENMLTKIREATSPEALAKARERVSHLFTEGAINKVLRDEALQVADGQERECLAGKGTSGAND